MNTKQKIGAVIIGVILLGSSAHAQAFELRFIGSTPLEIVTAWSALSDVQEYRLERSPSSTFSSVTSYALPETIHGFGDTGHNPNPPAGSDLRRFSPGASGSTNLSYAQTYFYRVRAILKNGTQSLSNSISAQLIKGSPASSVVRGTEGDLWADIVLGQPDFSEYTFGRPYEFGVDLAGGIAIDRSKTPNRLYIVDTNHNRVLGIQGNCAPGKNCMPEPGVTVPQVLLGQPNFGRAACNGDATKLSYPNKPTVSATSLCFAPGGSISPAEAVLHANFDTDANGNLYFTDSENSRVLKFNDPFVDPSGAGRVADEVWGQSDFTGNTCNNGGLSARSLCTNGRAAVDIDASGNLWVVDNLNNRVLRFPKNSTTGIINKTADVVLGQDNFSSYAFVAGTDNSTKYLYWPVTVRTDKDNNVYVFEQRGWGYIRTPRIIKYEASTIEVVRTKLGAGQNGTDAITATNTRVILPLPSATDQFMFQNSGSMAYDEARNGLWIRGNNLYYFYDIATETLTHQVGDGRGNLRGVDVDSDGNVHIIEVWDKNSIRRYDKTAVENSTLASPVPWTLYTTEFFAGKKDAPLDGFHGVTGMALAGNQLIVSNLDRLLFWNDYTTLSSGKSADGQWNFGNFQTNIGQVRVDRQNRLWVGSRYEMSSAPGPKCNTVWCLRIFATPLTANASPLKAISIGNLKTKEGTTINGLVYQDFIRFVPIGTGDSIWLVTENKGVFRLVNIDGARDAARGPYVDIILGRTSITDTGGCANTGEYTPTATSICIAADIAMDPDGNIWVEERSFAPDGIGTRLLRFDAVTIPENPTATVFAIPASKVYGTGGNFTKASDPTLDGGAHPFVPKFDSNGRMVFGTNSYTNSRFPLVNLDYKNVLEPQLSFGDFFAYPAHGFFDPMGNLYLGDWNWNRVLVYKKPLRDFIPPPTVPISVQYKLSVYKTGTGKGTVASNPSGIICGPYCTKLFNAGTLIFLPQQADIGSRFVKWIGCDKILDNICIVPMNSARSVTAQFDRVR